MVRSPSVLPGSPGAAARPRRRRVAAALLGLVVAALLLEVVLQVASYIAWRRQAVVARPDGRVILCIGDSLTFGLGAEPDEAYPIRLRHHLAERGAEWAVVNAGIPGQCSADVLRRLPALLRDLRPEVVLLLFGWNDTWARPAPLTAADLGDVGFPLRWRTGRLLATFFARTDTLQQRAATPFLGAWHVLDQEFYFAADGTARLGGLQATWAVEGEVLHLTLQSGGTLDLRWRRAEDAIEFAMFGWHRFERARRGPPSAQADIVHIDDMIARDQLDAALAALPALDVGAHACTARAHLATALMAAGRTDDAAALIAELEPRWRDGGDLDAGEALARWQMHRGDAAAACGLAQQLVAAHDDRVASWRILVDAAPVEQLAGIAARLATAAATQASPWRRAELTLERAVALAVGDAVAAVPVLVEARALGVSPDEVIAALSRAAARGADRASLLAAAERAALPDDERAALVGEVRRATVDDHGMFEVLLGHLGQAVDLVVGAGAQPVVLGYPFSMPRHEAEMQRFAAARGVPFVSLVGRFERQLAGAARSDWFVDQIHCSARGYDLMASEVAEQLAERLR